MKDSVFSISNNWMKAIVFTTHRGLMAFPYPIACLLRPLIARTMLPITPTKKAAGHRKTAIMKNAT
jgi:hypothetical protein